MSLSPTFGGGGEGGALKGSVGRAVPSSLFNTKIVHFATLFKTGDTTF